MPKAKRYRNKRITKAPPSTRKKQRKEDGRPRGTFKRYLFEETRLGFLLKYEAPVVYHIIMLMTRNAVFKEPSPLLIRQVCHCSADPTLRKKKFFKYLDEYERLGLYCKRPKRLTPEREMYYREIREKKLMKYISDNWEMIESMRKYGF